MLSEAVLALLSDNHSRTLSEIADAVSNSLDDPEEQEFRLACDLLFLLEDESSDDSDKDEDACSIARILNAEYLLYKLYEQFGSIEMNPFLSHFVAVYNEGKKAMSASASSGDGRHSENSKLMVQMSIVSLFLIGGGHILGDLKAADFLSVWPDLVRDDIDTDKFVDALVNQGVLDPPADADSAPESSGERGQVEHERAITEDRDQVQHPMPIRVIPNLITTSDIPDSEDDLDSSRLALYIRPMLERALSEELSKVETEVCLIDLYSSDKHS